MRGEQEGRWEEAKPKGRTHLGGISVPVGADPQGTGEAGEGCTCLLLLPVTPPHSGLRAMGSQVRAPSNPYHAATGHLELSIP